MKWIVLVIGLSCVVIEDVSASQRWFRQGSYRVVVKKTTSQCANGQCSAPVKTQPQCADGSCEVSVEVKPNRPIINTIKAVRSRVINRNQAAYEHALKEATYLAERLTVGHPFGVAPGCRMAGTGCSFSAENPNHCYKELPESRIVARAVVRGRDGRFYWSAHYR